MRMISRLLAARDRIARRSVRSPGRWCRSSLPGFDVLLRAAVVRRLSSSSVLSVGALMTMMTIPIRGGWDADGSERVFDRVVVVVHLEERRTRLQQDPVDVIIIATTNTRRGRRRRHDDDEVCRVFLRRFTRALGGVLFFHKTLN